MTWENLRDRAEALVEQTALDPVRIAQTLHHLSMLALELETHISGPEGLLQVAADLEVDYESRRSLVIDKELGEGRPITWARERANYQTRDDKRRAEQAKITAEYAKGVLRAVNRRHFELMNVGKHVNEAVGGRG